MSTTTFLPIILSTAEVKRQRGRETKDTLGQSDQTYAIVRCTTGLPTQIVVRPTDFNLPWQDGSANEVVLNSLTKYDENTCVYQYRSQQFSVGLSITVSVTVSDATHQFCPSHNHWNRRKRYIVPKTF